ncbi:hypothetical protein Zmor_007605 [Zophobas morio]|uniref:Odorant receptor n=1 Tax=Zophobas morio TaxID=2755281 RepID=A0AA38IYM7_9CUCU|nr:hypothetical protein Zmor_007605 [Zophobas morio]
MEIFDWKSTFYTNFRTLKMIGLWPEHNEGYKFDWYTLYTLFCVNLCFIGPNFTQIMDLLINTSDLETFTARIFLIISEILVPIKVYYHIKTISRGKELMQKTNATIFQPKTTTQRNLAQNQLDIWTGAYSIFCVSCFIATIISISVLVTADVNLDMFVVALIIFVSAQCDILCDELRNNLRRPNFHEKFLRCIKHHKEILSFKENTNDLYEIVIFWQTVLSSLSLALTMFHLTLVKFESSEIYGAMMYGLATSLETFLYCWFGNEAEVKV